MTDWARCCTVVQVEEAAKLAHLHNTVMQMPNGYNTMIGDRSEENLSDGQTQRLSLVRFQAFPPAPSLLRPFDVFLTTVDC